MVRWKEDSVMFNKSIRTNWMSACGDPLLHDYVDPTNIIVSTWHHQGFHMEMKNGYFWLARNLKQGDMWYPS